MQTLSSKHLTSKSIAHCSTSSRPSCCPNLHKHASGTKQHRVVTVRAAADINTDDVFTLRFAKVKQLYGLKEWAPVCAALGQGEQTILLRKGGIREPTFTPKANEFLLFPTSFHTDADLLKPSAAKRYQKEVQMEVKQMPQIPLQYLAVVTGSWTTSDPNVLQHLDPLHVYGPGFLETRLRWRSKDPLTLLEVRTYVLTQRLLLPPREHYFGCFGWVQLSPEDAANAQEKDAIAGLQGEEELLMRPALTDDQFRVKQNTLRQRLRQLDDSLQKVVFLKLNEVSQ